jgi:DNA repair exonuclease SbcCD ATPase subunit
LPDRIIAVRIPEEVYRELERKAKRLGFSLVSDYVRSIVLRELGYTSGVEPREDVERIVRDVIERRVEQLIAEGKVEVKPIDTEKLVDTIVRRVERRLQDIINPWTAKIDSLSTRMAEVIERIEDVEKRVEQVENQLSQLQERERTAQPYYQPQAEKRARRRSAIERLREQGVVFEHEVQWLRDRDAFFERLKREGALVLAVGGERVAIDRGFWENFREKIEMMPTANDDEIRVLLTKQQYELFKKLKEAGLVYFDATKRSWRFTEEIVGES